MPAPVNYTAQSAIAVMRQVIDTNIELSQNLDEGLDRRIATVSAYNVGTEKFRAPIQVDAGGQVAGLAPDGGPLPQGNGAEYLQFIIVPVSHDVAIASTDLMNRISEDSGGGADRVIVTDVVARLIAKAKTKMAHFRNCLLQGYNQGILATVDASYAAANPVPLAMLSFGNRLLDLNNVYQVTDANMNVLGQVTVLAKSKPTGATVDTVTLDNLPAGLAAGCFFIPLNYATGAPVGPAGLQYIINATQAGDMFGVQRTVEQVQAASANAGTAPLSLGVIDALEVRKSLSNGVDEDAEMSFYYTNPVQRVTAHQLGFAKLQILSNNGSQPTLDISPDRTKKWLIGGKEVQVDSVAAVDYLYDICPGLLGKARYPGSQKFMTGPIKGFWYQRMVNGQHTTTYDAHFQDSWTVYTRKPWCHAVAHNLGLNPALTVAA